LHVQTLHLFVQTFSRDTQLPCGLGLLPIVGVERPANERSYMLIPVGYPTEDCMVPKMALERKPLDEIMVLR
jgi:hypothetical protein